MIARICSTACAVPQSLLSGSQAEPSCVQAFSELYGGLTSSTIMRIRGVRLHCQITHPASRNRHLHKLATWSTPICFADRSGNCLFKVHVAGVLVLLEVQQQDALFAEQQSFPLAQALRIRRQLHLHRMPGNVLWKPTGDVSEVSCHTNSSFYE